MQFSAIWLRPTLCRSLFLKAISSVTFDDFSFVLLLEEPQFAYILLYSLRGSLFFVCFQFFSLSWLRMTSFFEVTHFCALSFEAVAFAIQRDKEDRCGGKDEVGLGWSDIHTPIMSSLSQQKMGTQNIPICSICELDICCVAVRDVQASRLMASSV